MMQSVEQNGLALYTKYQRQVLLRPLSNYPADPKHAWHLTV